MQANVAALFPEGYESEFIEIGNLPFYNQDYDNENNVRPEYTTLRNRIKEIDAVLFVTPEYNRSVPAVLSNALDIGSRPYGAKCMERQTGSDYQPVSWEFNRFVFHNIHRLLKNDIIMRIGIVFNF